MDGQRRPARDFPRSADTLAPPLLKPRPQRTAGEHFGLSVTLTPVMFDASDVICRS